MTTHPYTETFAEMERVTKGVIGERVAELEQFAAKPAFRVSNDFKEQLATLRSSVSEFNSDAEILRRQLAKFGIKPHAIMPRGAWDAIRKYYGLLELNFNKDGSVNAIMPDFMKIKRDLDNEQAAWAMLLSGILWLAAIATTVYVYSDTMTSSIFWSTCGWVVLGIFFYNMMPDNHNSERLVAGFMRKSHLERLRSLFPGQRTSKKPEMTLTIKFSNPPETVAKRVRKMAARNTALSVTLEPDAVYFYPSLDLQLKKLFEKAVVEAGRTRSATLISRPSPGPIIHVNHGLAVAIVDQYGDFKMDNDTILQVLMDEVSLLRPHEVNVSKQDIFADQAPNNLHYNVY